MRRLTFLKDERWDEVEDDKRVRWFGYGRDAGSDRLRGSLRLRRRRTG